MNTNRHVGGMYRIGHLGKVVCGVAMVAAFSVGASAQELTLWRFSSNDGSFPSGDLVLSNDGLANLTSTTTRGGDFDQGTVFEINVNSMSLSVLHSFDLSTEGGQPNAGLVSDSVGGNYFGTTYGGGTGGHGTVFQLDQSNTLTVLHSFAGGPADGANPLASLITDADFNLYGTTTYGGASNFGTVFRVTPSGDFVLLHSFSGADGQYPQAPLVEYAGDFYGTTANGGDTGRGVVFKVTASGDFTVLYSFTGGDGAFPSTGLIVDQDGTLYGTAEFGGGSGYGTIFDLTQAGDFAVLHSFTGGDGVAPRSKLSFGPAGGLYGTTRNGGDNNNGTVFRWDPPDQLTVYYSFSGSDDGGRPFAGLYVQDNGPLGLILFGTTYERGDLTRCGGFGCGTVFQLTVPASTAGVSRNAR